MNKKSQAGFSLIELLIVVAIILTLAAIAIPNYLNSRMAADEASAVQSLRTIQTALTSYTSTYPSIGFPAQLSNLGSGSAAPCMATATQACLIDSILSSGIKSGYSFTYIQGAGTTPSFNYTLNADPLSRGITGRRSFFTDQPGVIRYNASGPATVTDPTI